MTHDSPSGREQLHFYPGDKILLYVVDGKVRRTAEAWGGPETVQPIKPGETMAAEPTHAGVFVIGSIAPYATKTWAASRIPWGTPIRQSRIRSTEVEYQTPSGRWRRLVIKDRNRRNVLTAASLSSIYSNWYPSRHVAFPETWFLNDFGPTAIRYYKDKNKNRKKDADEPLLGEMIHTTAQNEAEAEENREHPEKVVLDLSHGCIHIKPADRDEFIGVGAFRKGMTLIVHRYEDHYTTGWGGLLL